MDCEELETELVELEIEVEELEIEVEEYPSMSPLMIKRRIQP
jgi:hypothetical protein